MNMNNTNMSTITMVLKKDTSMDNATIYYAVKDAINNYIINNHIDPDSDNYISELKNAIDNKLIKVTDTYFIESQKYVKKCLSKIHHDRISALNNAYGYENNNKNEDLISIGTLQLYQRFHYLVKKFFEHTVNSESEEETIKKFNGAVALIIPSMLTDMFRKVSSTQTYEDVNPLTGEKITKSGRGVHPTVSTISIDKNNSTEADEEITIGDSLISSEVSQEQRLISRESIIDYLTPIINSPRELLGFMCVYLDISADEIINMMSKKISMSNIFTKVCKRFSIQYDVPEIMYLTKQFSENDLTYSGKMEIKKQLSNERSLAKNKVKRYIQN